MASCPCESHAFRDEDIANPPRPELTRILLDISCVRMCFRFHSKYTKSTKEDKGQFYPYLLAKYCKVWLKNSLHLLNDVRKRSTIHVLKNKIYDTIVVKRLVAHNYIWTLCCLIYFELLYYLLAHCFLNIHLNTLQKELWYWLINWLVSWVKWHRTAITRDSSQIFVDLNTLPDDLSTYRPLNQYSLTTRSFSRISYVNISNKLVLDVALTFT